MDRGAGLKLAIVDDSFIPEYYETYNLPNVHLVDCPTDTIKAIAEKGA